jgi:hypothetical protein
MSLEVPFYAERKLGSSGFASEVAPISWRGESVR